MIDAEINNKIPKLENWEDILTSNVFGLLELIEYKHLLNIISIAKNDMEETIANIKDKNIKTVELWKNFKNIGEPDILVTLDDGMFFIIEVKYFSHEHNKKTKKTEEDNFDDETKEQEKGQLAKYLDIEIAGYKRSGFIIYLTADYQSIKQIKESKSSSRECLDKIYHIHWDEFNGYLQQIQEIEGIEKKIIDKIINYLNFKGFKYWKGLKYKKEEYNIQITKRGFYGDK